MEMSQACGLVIREFEIFELVFGSRLTDQETKKRAKNYPFWYLLDQTVSNISPFTTKAGIKIENHATYANALANFGMVFNTFLSGQICQKWPKLAPDFSL